MLTGKQRSFLRGLANPLKATLQLGKEGMTEEFVKQYDEMIESRELVKINVLESNGLDVKEVAQDLAQRSKSDVVQVIGHKVTLYRASLLDQKIDLIHLRVHEAKSKEADTGKKKRPVSFPKLGRTTGPNSKAMRKVGIKAQVLNSGGHGKPSAKTEGGQGRQQGTASGRPSGPKSSAGRGNTQKKR